MIDKQKLNTQTLKKIQKVFLFLAIFTGLLSGIFGVINPYKFYESYLTGYLFNLSILLGSLFFVLILYLTRAGWASCIRRIPELIMNNFLLMALLFVPLIFGFEHLYHWLEPGAAEHDPILKSKTGYLNSIFLYIRLCIYFIVWHKISSYFFKQSIKQDEIGDRSITKVLQNRSAICVLLYALSITFAAFDLIMSIESHWFSTIFGVHYFSISILLALCFISLITILIYKKKILKDIITKEHIHDLGKLIFGFLVFWAYISFSQYFLIWYANIPEETFWYLKRGNESWINIAYILVIGHFIIPFFLFITKHSKRNISIHIFVIVLLIAMSYLDLFYLIKPSFDQNISIHILDFTTPIFILSILLMSITQKMKKHAILPVNEPRLQESIKLEVR